MKFWIGVCLLASVKALKVEERLSSHAENIQAAFAKMHKSMDLQDVIANAPKFSKDVIESDKLSNLFPEEKSESSPLLSTSTLPSDMTQIMAEMRAKLRTGELFPSPARVIASMLQKETAAWGKEPLSRNDIEKLEENLIHAAEGFRQNEELHDEILSHLPKLYDLVAHKTSTLKPLMKYAQHVGNQSHTSVDLPAEHVKDMLGNSSLALMEMGADPNKGFWGNSNCVSYSEADAEKSPYSTNPYMRLALHFGSKLVSTGDQAGRRLITITFGWKNEKFPWFINFMKGLFVARLGFYENHAEGDRMSHRFGGQFQFDIAPMKSPALEKYALFGRFMAIKQMALTLHYKPIKEYPPETIAKWHLDNKWDTRFIWVGQVGGGLKYENVKGMRGHLANRFYDFLLVPSFEDKMRDKPYQGAVLDIAMRFGDQSVNDNSWMTFFQKWFIMCTWRYKPEAFPDQLSKQIIPGVAVRVFKMLPCLRTIPKSADDDHAGPSADGST